MKVKLISGGTVDAKITRANAATRRSLSTQKALWAGKTDSNIKMATWQDEYGRCSIPVIKEGKEYKEVSGE